MNAYHSSDRIYVAYDARAMFGSTEDASVLVATDSLEEAIATVESCFGEGTIYSYRNQKGKLVGERWEHDVINV